MKILRLPSNIAVFLLLLSCSEEKSVRTINTPIITEETEFKDDPKLNRKVKIEPEPEPEPEPIKDVELEVVEKPSKMAEKLTGKTSYVYDHGAILRNINKTPKHYIFYFSGEWSGKCRENLPILKKFYTEQIKENVHIELIMVSSDDPQWLTKWGQDEGFEWPLIMGKALHELPVLKFNAERYAYYFMIMDDEGQLLEKGSLDDCMLVLADRR